MSPPAPYLVTRRWVKEKDLEWGRAAPCGQARVLVSSNRVQEQPTGLSNQPIQDEPSSQERQ